MKRVERIQKYVEKIKNECFSRDIESDHQVADEILIQLLTELGYDDVVKEYNCVKKWYA